MQRPQIALAAITSAGPREIPQSDGSTYRQAVPCFVCDGPIDTGERISKIGGRWAHAECAKSCVDSAEVRTAWALIGEDIARHPRAYGVRQIRTVVEQLASLVHEAVYRDELDQEDEAGRSLITPEVFRQIAEGGDL
jgi:hypothetical protein